MKHETKYLRKLQKNFFEVSTRARSVKLIKMLKTLKLATVVRVWEALGLLIQVFTGQVQVEAA